MPLAEFGGTLGVKRAAHLLRRATFGATKSQIDTFATLTPAQAITRLFHQALPDPPLPMDPKTGTEWVVSGVTNANSEDNDLEVFFMCWHLAQMMSAGVPENLSLAYSARERLVFFLHTHFTTIKSKVGRSTALYYQNELFRQFALDSATADPLINFKTLTVKISIDNAMLRLLDGNLNVKGNPNENYARELLELYTIGRGLEGKVPAGLPQGDYFVYTEEDVQAAAKVLSGWENNYDFDTIDADTNLPRGRVRGTPMNASAHDNTVKNFSSRFGNATITPEATLMNGTFPTESSALDELEQLIDLIYAKPETVRNICWKIYRFFVYSPHDKYEAGNLVARIDEEIIPAMADVFVSSGYKILPVIENLLRSQHFYDSGNGDVTDDNFGGIIKSPLDLVTGALRAFSVSIPDMATQTEAFYEKTGMILDTIDHLGMSFYEPFDVAGYEAYHQFPIYNRIWITPNSLARRYEFIRNIFNSAEPMMFTVNAYDYVNTNFSTQASDARALIIAIATYFFPVPDNLNFDDAADDTAGLTAKRINYFKERFLAQFDETYWTTRWNEGAGDLREQLEILFNTMLQTPEYQLA